MNRRTLAVAALTGLVTNAPAQTIGTVTITTSVTTVNVGDTFTVGVFLTDNTPGIYVGAFDVHVSGVGAAFSTVPDGLVIDPSGSGLVWTDGFLGGIEPDGARGAGSSINLIFPFSPDQLEDLTVFSFQVRATQGGIITFNASDAGLTDIVDAIGWINSCGVGPCFMPYDEVTFNSATVTVIPTPPSLIPLALAAPIVTRPRRRPIRVSTAAPRAPARTPRASPARRGT
ncbi:MAG: hypothetical protein R3B57_08930 [Phycisphaerales bacterium]